MRQDDAAVGVFGPEAREQAKTPMRRGVHGKALLENVKRRVLLRAQYAVGNPALQGVSGLGVAGLAPTCD